MPNPIVLQYWIWSGASVGLVCSNSGVFTLCCLLTKSQLGMAESYAKWVKTVSVPLANRVCTFEVCCRFDCCGVAYALVVTFRV